MREKHGQTEASLNLEGFLARNKGPLSRASVSSQIRKLHNLILLPMTGLFLIGSVLPPVPVREQQTTEGCYID